jgi:hypothetical protein
MSPFPRPFLPSPTMAGPTTLTVSQGFFLDIENNNNSHFAIALNSYQSTTGSAMGNAYYSNSYSAQLLNSLPPPLFPGILTTAQTSGFADSNTLGSTATSSIADASTVEVYLSAPSILLFSTTYSIRGSVQPSSSGQSAAIFGDVYVYFNGKAVYSTSGTTGSFLTGDLSTLNVSGSSSLIAVDAPAGFSQFVEEPYASETITTESLPPPPASVPEPSSLVLVILGASSIGLYLGVRRVQGKRLRS